MEGPELLAIRRALGWTQAKMAQMLGCWRPSYTRWETGVHAIPDNVARHARVLAENARLRRQVERLRKGRQS